MTAWYNEIDPRMANVLRELIAEGHIAPGVVDERSIVDVRADDLRGFTQCHFFAGIGVWSHALRRAGWPDDRPAWTGSCPCQPFSLAGSGAGFDDPRHLWPHWVRLIGERRPYYVFGEQVAAAHLWIDLVRAGLEAHGYAVGVADLAAAGFAGAHIRQRFFWVADSYAPQWWADYAPRHVGDGPAPRRIEGYGDTAGGGAARGLALADGGHPGPERQQRGGEQRLLTSDGPVGRVADDDDGRCAGQPHARLQRPLVYDADGRSPCGRLGDDDDAGLALGPWEADGRGAVRFQGAAAGPASPLFGCDWLLCSDAKIRPVEPGTFPLADAAPARLGRLHGYGNAIDAETAAQFVSAYIDSVELAA